ncbi:MAG: type II toxin-antitoxin system VapC family toxin [Scytonema sp. PMC 1069.18]|nr:type II toxin-antitoxin system VapC family toxin [Scytonema sp. PMC 1069.18]MEC4886405.1 type II toxin-antitoxin system VapC family toxin [Scytonema sp. PMC 1070.18]
MYLLDTNHCSQAILGNANVLHRLAEVENTVITTCAIVQGELIDMAERSQRKESNLALIHRFLTGIYSRIIISHAVNRENRQTNFQNTMLWLFKIMPLVTRQMVDGVYVLECR